MLANILVLTLTLLPMVTLIAMSVKVVIDIRQSAPDKSHRRKLCILQLALVILQGMAIYASKINEEYLFFTIPALIAVVFFTSCIAIFFILRPANSKEAR